MGGIQPFEFFDSGVFVNDNAGAGVNVPGLFENAVGEGKV